MSILIAIAAIGIILFTLPLLLSLIGAILGLAVGLFQWVIGAAIIIFGLMFAFDFFSENPDILIGILGLFAIVILFVVVVKIVSFVGSKLFPKMPNMSDNTSEVLGPKKKIIKKHPSRLSDETSNDPVIAEIDEDGNEIFGGLDSDDWPDTEEIIQYISRNGLSLLNLDNMGTSPQGFENLDEFSKTDASLADRVERAANEKKLRDVLEHISEIKQFISSVNEQQKWLIENFDDLLYAKSLEGETLPIIVRLNSILNKPNVPRVNVEKFHSSLNSLGLIKQDFRQKFERVHTRDTVSKLYAIAFKSSRYYRELILALAEEQLTIQINAVENFIFSRKQQEENGTSGTSET